MLIENIFTVKSFMTTLTSKQPILMMSIECKRKWKKKINILLLFKMSPFVICSISCSSKASWAITTMVRFFSCMCSHMNVVISFFYESWITQLAIDGIFLIQMESADMEIKSWFPWIWFLTFQIVALISFLVCR